MKTLFTLGASGKSAQEFFAILHDHAIERILDVRLRNTSQLCGFTKKPDLEFLLHFVDVTYFHMLELAPTAEMLYDYNYGIISWEMYTFRFLGLLADRGGTILPNLNHACFLCSEPKPDFCHRRLAAEYFKEKHGNIEIIHL